MKLRRKDIAYFATVALLLALIVLGSIRLGSRGARGRSATAPQEDDPAQIIFDMVGFQTRGDASGYLGCFIGQLREKLQKDADEMGAAEFSSYLRDTGQAIKGVAAVGEPEMAGAQANVHIEFVYEGKFIETQQFTLRRSGRGWRIYAMSPREPKEALVEYGTPAQPVQAEKAANTPMGGGTAPSPEE
jgi:hypothetical protein